MVQSTSYLWSAPWRIAIAPAGQAFCRRFVWNQKHNDANGKSPDQQLLVATMTVAALGLSHRSSLQALLQPSCGVGGYVHLQRRTPEPRVEPMPKRQLGCTSTSAPMALWRRVVRRATPQFSFNFQFLVTHAGSALHPRVRRDACDAGLPADRRPGAICSYNQPPDGLSIPAGKHPGTRQEGDPCEKGGGPAKHY